MSGKFYTDDDELIEVNKEWGNDFVGVCISVRYIKSVTPIDLFITTKTAKLIADSLVKYAKEVEDEQEEIEKKEVSDELD